MINTESVRRTELAAERTWLAWWRTGIATTATAIAIGGVLPRLVEGSRELYVALGSGYAIMAIALFIAAYKRQTTVISSIGHERTVNVNPRVVLGFTVSAVALAIATIVVTIISA
ncbi:MAG: DUF202 domain-containing protein [Thermoleophilaceae bacterium]|nr:DUF202 domain-containing protein [Thermoleophilaceae bacterium]